MGDHVVSSISEFLNPEATGLSIVRGGPVSWLHYLAKYMHLLSQFLILVGVVTLMLNRKGMKFQREYEAFILPGLVMCFATIAVPYILTTTRFYHIALFFLAPFFVIGGVTVFKLLAKAIRVSWKEQHMRISLPVLSVFLAVFLLFNTGFVYEVARDHPGSVSLSQEWVEEHGDPETKAAFYTMLTPAQEVFSAKWLSMNIQSGEKVYATYNDISVHALTSYGMVPIEDVLPLTRTTKTIEEDDYVYLQYLNVVDGLGTEYRPWLPAVRASSIFDMAEISQTFEGKNKIYSNGASEIYK